MDFVNNFTIKQTKIAKQLYKDGYSLEKFSNSEIVLKKGLIEVKINNK